MYTKPKFHICESCTFTYINKPLYKIYLNIYNKIISVLSTEKLNTYKCLKIQNTIMLQTCTDLHKKISLSGSRLINCKLIHYGRLISFEECKDLKKNKNETRISNIDKQNTKIIVLAKFSALIDRTNYYDTKNLIILRIND
uniref:Uncharacterized protein n=1 Tax=Faxonius propinquus nudivirus TaxID=3139431 RepID=A0AAU8GBZ2_9VIRU